MLWLIDVPEPFLFGDRACWCSNIESSFVVTWTYLCSKVEVLADVNMRVKVAKPRIQDKAESREVFEAARTHVKQMQEKESVWSAEL